MDWLDTLIMIDYIINWIFRIGLLVLAYNIIEYLNYK